MITDHEVSAAYERIRGDIVRTPLEYSGPLSRLCRARVFIKWETEQITGSFKFRGAMNKIRVLSAVEKRAGLIAASTGNHGLGVVRAAALEKARVVLYLPRTAAPAKIAKLKDAGAVVEMHGSSCERAEIAARRKAVQSGNIYISPYNDIDVVAGQGTIGLEILEDCPAATAIFVPVGGGGLIAGIGAFVKNRRPDVRIVGVEPAASAFMKASLRAGKIVSITEGPTAADAVAGGLEPGSITLALCQKYVDEIKTVGEDRLRKALFLYGCHHRRMVEGAGGLALAACLKEKEKIRNRTIVLVASGGNIDPARWSRLTGLRPGKR
ncbi:MAG: threonine ammonia-lyase [Candidatus Aminicenantales bacterium]